MYVITFYSFRGGVGRTMAAVNVAVTLANMGRRILLVDFDLEAPAIPTYDSFAEAAHNRGVVDYVCEYLDTGRSPDVKDFITRKPVRVGPEEGGIWVMSAGLQESLYAARLQGIDWQELYTTRD